MRLPFHLAAPAFCLLVLALCGPVGQAADETKGKPLDAPVATSGPVHEAFASAKPTSLEPPPLVEKAPPRPLEEEIPNEKPEGENVQWIPGYWEYDGEANKFVWVSGVWRIPPPGRQWASGYWSEVDGQWRRQPGFWAAFNEDGKAQELIYYPKPPEPKGENQAEAPPNKVFAPGSWTYGAGGYTWSAGQYINAAPGWYWTAASYSWTPAGYTYTRGYWDYSYVRRGLVYAPVVLPATVRNVTNYYYRPTRVIAPAYLARALAVASVTSPYYLKNARITDVSKVTSFKLVALTNAQRARYQTLAAQLNQTAVTRSRLEAKGSATIARGPVRHAINLPRPLLNATRGDSRFQPPPRPATAGARTAPPPRKNAAPAPSPKKDPPRKPTPPPAAKKDPPKKPAPPPPPKKEPAKKNNAKKTGDKPQHKK
jgi:hypothetical protein